MSTILWIIGGLAAAGIAFCKAAQRADQIMKQQYRAELKWAEHEGAGQ
jgi:hypothetical protein